MTAYSTTKPDLVANYKYIVTDLTTGDLLAEIPFTNVTYGRSLKEAGSFSGDITSNEATFNMELYANTLPGRTALFIIRNDVCVWGGIIWARTYDIISRTLSVSGSEFTSYFYHRILWKTWKNEYEATVTLAGGSGTATLTYDTHTFVENSPIYVSFGSDLHYDKNGYYYVSSVISGSEFTFSGGSGGYVTGDFTDDGCTITVRQDSYDYIRDLLESLKMDFYTMKYPNTEIEPAVDFDQSISNISRSSNIATLTFNEDHALVVGQRFTLRNVPTSYMTNTLGENTGRHIVLDSPTATTVTFSNSGPNNSTSLSPSVLTISAVSRDATGTVTLTTSSPHGFAVGDVVSVSNVHGAINGEQTVTGIPSSVTFTFSTPFAIEIAPSQVGTGAIVTRSPSARFSSYGEYTDNSTFDISYDPASSLSSQNPRVNPIFRGSELKTVGEILDDYSNTPDGFEYRIDCTYNSGTGKFDKVFKFLPLKPQSLVDYLNNTYATGLLPVGVYAPPEAFGADALVFEHPGNILNASMEETVEDASTRFWVQGEDDTGNADASLPYAAESSLEYLTNGWPLLENVEKVNSVSDESTLFTYASRYLTESLPPISHFSITVNGSVKPELGTYAPGDWCSVIINDDDFVSLRMQSDLEPGSSQANRQGMLIRKIESYEVTVPDNPSFPEEVSLQLVSERAIDIVGSPIMDIETVLVTQTSAYFDITIMQDNTTTTSVTLKKDNSTIQTWSLAPGAAIKLIAYEVGGLTADTSYEFVWEVASTGAKAYKYVRTNA